MAGVHAILGGTTPGGGSATVDVQAAAYSVTVINPSSATTEVRFDNDGTVYILSDVEVPYAWLVTGVNSGLEVKFETTTGTLSTGTANTWLTLDTDQIITVSRSGIGLKKWTGVIRIRLAAAPFTELDSAIVSLNATVETDL